MKWRGGIVAYIRSRGIASILKTLVTVKNRSTASGFQISAHSLDTWLGARGLALMESRLLSSGERFLPLIVPFSQTLHPTSSFQWRDHRVLDDNEIGTQCVAVTGCPTNGIGATEKGGVQKVKANAMRICQEINFKI